MPLIPFSSWFFNHRFFQKCITDKFLMQF
jgi:hypothetical protein